jgi:hypothetical protein
VLEVATEWMFAEPSIMETIALVSKALHEYERAGGFAPAATTEVADAALEAPAAGIEPAADASALPPTREGEETPLPQPVEAARPTGATSTTGVAEGAVGEAESSPPRPIATSDDDAREPDEPAAAAQERVAPEDTTRVASPEIQEVEEAVGTALLQGVTSGEALVLDLACTSWAATSGSGDDTEDDEEAAARNTLERGLNWARHAFDELILPATLISFLV